MTTTLPAVLFVDRDGTLVEEPPDEQVDRIDKIRFLPGVFAALQTLRSHGFRLVLVSNQDGLGTTSFPREDFEAPQQFMLEAFRSQGIEFDEVFICPHFSKDDCACRKPRTGLLDAWLAQNPIDRARSAVLGDRETDRLLAENLGLKAVRVCKSDDPKESWPAAVHELTARRARIVRTTNETHIEVSVDLDAEGPVSAHTGIGFFDHMVEQLGKHSGIALALHCKGDLQIDEHHTVEDCALALGEALRSALGDKRGIGRYGFLLPMDEAQAQVAIDLSGRAYARFEGTFGRERIGELPTELVPHFFRSLGESLGAAIHVKVDGDNSHHMVEACFKAVGRALRDAFRRRGFELPTTKGLL